MNCSQCDDFREQLDAILEEGEISDEMINKHIQKLESQNKKLVEALRFYANNVASVWDCNGENLLEECSETARAVLKEVAG